MSARWLLLGILAAPGCAIVGPDVVWVDGAIDTGAPEPDPDDTGEWEEPASTGSAAVFYSFGENGLGAASCADAGLQTLSLAFSDRGVLTVGPWAYPCVDDELRAGDLAEGNWHVTVVGEMHTGVLFAAEGDLYVVAGEERELELVLECRENGVDDGCGGA